MNAHTKIQPGDKVVLPTEAVAALGLPVGTTLRVHTVADGFDVRVEDAAKSRPFKPTTMADLLAFPPYDGPPRTTEEISSVPSEWLRENTPGNFPAVDANVVVRVLAHDDGRQVPIAVRTVEDGVHILPTVLLEIVWVISSRMGYAREPLCDRLDALLGQSNVSTDNPAAIRWAIDQFRAGADFADALHVALAAGRPGFLTFDRDLIRKLQPATAMTLTDLDAKQQRMAE